jgi:kinesin family protein 11
VANNFNAKVSAVTNSVHEETIRIVDAQIQNIATQMAALDDFVTKAREQNTQHSESHAATLKTLSGTVLESYESVQQCSDSAAARVKALDQDLSQQSAGAQEALAPMQQSLKQHLQDLRDKISTSVFREYVPTGETPQRHAYQYPAVLPRTEPNAVLAALRAPPQLTSTTPATSPSKMTSVPVVFNDITPSAGDKESLESLPVNGLKEIDVNVNAGHLESSSANSTTTISLSDKESGISAAFRRSVAAGNSGIKMPNKSKRQTVVPLEGRENATAVLPAEFSRSMGPAGSRRRSPRNGTGPA